jgi:hypothetical protein
VRHNCPSAHWLRQFKVKCNGGNRGSKSHVRATTVRPVVHRWQRAKKVQFYLARHTYVLYLLWNAYALAACSIPSPSTPPHVIILSLDQSLRPIFFLCDTYMRPSARMLRACSSPILPAMCRGTRNQTCLLPLQLVIMCASLLAAGASTTIVSGQPAAEKEKKKLHSTPGQGWPKLPCSGW